MAISLYMDVRANASKFYRPIKIWLVNFDMQFFAHLKPAYLLSEKFRCVCPAKAVASAVANVV